MDDSSTSRPPRATWAAIILLLLLVPGGLLARTANQALVRNLEVASVSGGGELGNGGSFFVTTSYDGRYVTYESLATNLVYKPPAEVIWSDIYLRDRLAGQTYKVSRSYDGGLTNEASVDPTISADGRYVAYFSYASNIIPNDTNHEEYNRVGLDVFVWDRLSDQNVRVSLDEHGREIDGNSVGSISADGQFILMVSDGRVFDDDWDSNNPTALYLRDWRTGSVERISKALNGGFPNSEVLYESMSADNRYIAYASEASNLAANDFNGEMDVFLYDRQSGQTRLISRDASGNPANGRSSQPEISADGKSITFLSYATNLVPGDSNGLVDIFVYDLDTEALTLVSRAPGGSQGNGDSREPAICGDGRFIAYTTEATNLVANDNNNQRDVILHDRLKGTNSAATVNADGALGNGKAHRSFLTADCRSVAFASDASNLVPQDNNAARDIFIGEIYLPADLSASRVRVPGAVAPGQLITYTFELRNLGYVAATAVLTSPMPASATYVDGSGAGGASYNAGENRVEWQGEVAAGGRKVISYAVEVSPPSSEPMVVTSQSTLAGDGSRYALVAKSIIGPEQVFLPLAARR